MNKAQQINRHLQEAVLAYHNAVLLANECPDLLLDWSEENSEEVGKRMQNLYARRDRMFGWANQVDSKLAIAVRLYEYASKRFSSHPDSYRSDGGNRAEITKLYQDMEDRKSEMFAEMGIEYHG